LITNSKNYYSNPVTADNYDKDRFTTFAGQMFDTFEKDIVLSNLPPLTPDSIILEVGVGTGRFSIAVAQKNYNIIASDYSPAMLKIIKSKIDKELSEKITILRQDTSNLSFKDDSFDYVYCLRVTVNLDTQVNVEQCIREMVRVCKHEGVICFDIVNPISLAFFGGRRETIMIPMKKMKKIISDIPDTVISRSFGGRILSQTVFEKSPKSFLPFIDSVDKFLSGLFPALCVRNYYVITKK
jgi:ubiquinone/menaquinone biosynthesis C-methylase UbiE